MGVARHVTYLSVFKHLCCCCDCLCCKVGGTFTVVYVLVFVCVFLAAWRHLSFEVLTLWGHLRRRFNACLDL